MTPLAGPVLTAADMRDAEQRAMAAGVSVDTLMERAGEAVAAAVWRLGGGRPTLVLCGPGNNGGDGYVAARKLAERGTPVRVAALREPRAPAAVGARARWTGPVEALDAARPEPVLVDALFGTGLQRPLEEPVARRLSELADGAGLTLAVDLPSGVESDRGEVWGVAPCDVTLALGALKPAHLLQPSAACCGHVIVAGIGVPASSSLCVLERPRLGAPTGGDHKYSRGMVAVVAGGMAGAATLGVSAAAHLAGYTILCGKADAPAAVVRRGFEKTIADPKLGAMLIGPGLADTPEARDRLEAALASAVPLVLDAGALALVSPELRRAAPVIMTPHEGEFARLFGVIAGSKVDRARIASRRSGAIILLKGADSVVAHPDGRAVIATGLPPWLATAGTGDVLAGIAAGLLARGEEPFAAAAAAVWLQAEAARRAGPALIADDLIPCLQAALARCL